MLESSLFISKPRPSIGVKEVFILGIGFLLKLFDPTVQESCIFCKFRSRIDCQELLLQILVEMEWSLCQTLFLDGGPLAFCLLGSTGPPLISSLTARIICSSCAWRWNPKTRKQGKVNRCLSLAPAVHISSLSAAIKIFHTAAVILDLSAWKLCPRDTTRRLPRSESIRLSSLLPHGWWTYAQTIDPFPRLECFSTGCLDLPMPVYSSLSCAETGIRFSWEQTSWL